jgi:hypothetical protein
VRGVKRLLQVVRGTARMVPRSAPRVSTVTHGRASRAMTHMLGEEMGMAGRPHVGHEFHDRPNGVRKDALRRGSPCQDGPA